ncbi:TonB-dependent receptor [Zavarzinia sp.]|uniref:TonB-dependent receptor n=1 Tax=Zavarzinia sp. TaxID=2027920 RepID=UPI0035671103
MTDHLLRSTALAALTLALTPAAWAEEATSLPTVVVEAPAETPFGTTTEGGTATTADSARLLSSTPGVTLQAGGALSSLPVLNGLADERVRLLLDGMTVTNACPNHMIPALSYIDAGRIGQIQAIAGVTPVSLGGDSIAGTIVVEPAAPLFATPDKPVLSTGRLSTFFRSNTSGLTVSGDLTLATPDMSWSYAGSWSRDMDYHRGGDGKAVRSTEAQTYDHNFTFGLQRGSDRLTIRAGLTRTPYEGFPNQRMDLTDNKSHYLNARYEGEFDWGSLDSRLYWHHTSHEMDMLADKGGAMPMNTRANDYGYSLAATIPLGEIDTLRVGNELHYLGLNDWWPPVAGSMMMGPETYVNINDGRRVRIGTYGEWQRQWTSALRSEIGVRNDVVLMDTGEVRPYSWTAMMQAADIAAANAFNAMDRSRTDINFDATGLLSYDVGSDATYALGLARKTRSPSLYERYSWGQGNMAAAMNNWYGDANGYLGNPDLDPEVAYTLGISADWHRGSAWRVKVTPYVSYVDGFIDADPTGRTFGPGGQFVVLRFANHDALLYGVDVSGSLSLAKGGAFGDLDLSGTAGLVMGENRDTHDDLYHLAPLHGRIALDHRLGDWSNALELVGSVTKDQVNDARNEPETPGYALVNFRTAYQWPGVRVEAGVENLFDQRYYDPLGGVDFSDFKIEGGAIRALPGEGRSFTVGLTLTY